MPTKTRFPFKKPHAGRVFGVSLDKVRTRFLQTIDEQATSFRVYRVIHSVSEGPRFVARVLNRYGDRFLYEIMPDGIKIPNQAYSLGFRKIGNFSNRFNDREIYDRSLRKIGFGSTALRYHLANLKRKGLRRDRQNTSKKSTARLFIKYGYKIASLAYAPKLYREAHRGELPPKEKVKEYLKMEDTPEDLPFKIFFTKAIK